MFDSIFFNELYSSVYFKLIPSDIAPSLGAYRGLYVGNYGNLYLRR